MTDPSINNMFNHAGTEYLTELTIKVQVPLSLDDIRRFVVAVDAEESSEEDAIAPENVSALDMITMWLVGEYTGDAQVVVDEMKVL